MSSGATATPELVFKIAKATVSTELTPPPVEVATADAGIVTESFGPMQITLQNAHVKGTLHPGTPYDIKAATPRNFDARNMQYVGKLDNGALLFRAPMPKV
ncbi:MAG: hypothetical protein ABSG03_39410 [Bryobacteraceae bacterium]|jgi:hypothetical protein